MTPTVTQKAKILAKIEDKFFSDYTGVATDVIAGKYGNGAERKTRVRDAGYDPDVVQIFVNVLIGG